MRGKKSGTAWPDIRLGKKLAVLREKWHTLPINWKLSILLSVFLIAFFGAVLYRQTHLYTFSDSEKTLLARGSVGKDAISETSDKIYYNKQDDSSEKQKFTVGGSTEATSKLPYKAELPKDASEGIVFGDTKSESSFKMIPLHETSEGRLEDGRVIYPESLSAKHVYTFKRNGIKEDILLTKSPGNWAQK